MIYSVVLKHPSECEYGLLVDQNGMPIFSGKAAKVKRNFLAARLKPIDPYVAFGFWEDLNPSICAFSDQSLFSNYTRSLPEKVWEFPNGSVYVGIKDDLEVRWSRGEQGLYLADYPAGDSASYDSLITYSIKAVMNRIVHPTSTNPIRWFGLFQARVNEEKFQVFRTKGLTCVYCKLKARYFRLERHSGARIRHFNAYGINQDDEEVLLGIDHIIPKSLGGDDSLNNLQVLCKRCNSTKANM